MKPKRQGTPRHGAGGERLSSPSPKPASTEGTQGRGHTAQLPTHCSTWHLPDPFTPTTSPGPPRSVGQPQLSPLWTGNTEPRLSLSPTVAPSSQELGGPPPPPKRWASDRKPLQNPPQPSYLEKPAACCEEPGWSLPQGLTLPQVFPLSIPRAGPFPAAEHYPGCPTQCCSSLRAGSGHLAGLCSAGRPGSFTGRPGNGGLGSTGFLMGCGLEWGQPFPTRVALGTV